MKTGSPPQAQYNGGGGYHPARGGYQQRGGHYGGGNRRWQPQGGAEFEELGLVESLPAAPAVQTNQGGQAPRPGMPQSNPGSSGNNSVATSAWAPRRF